MPLAARNPPGKASWGLQPSGDAGRTPRGWVRPRSCQGPCSAPHCSRPRARPPGSWAGSRVWSTAAPQLRPSRFSLRPREAPGWRGEDGSRSSTGFSPLARKATQPFGTCTRGGDSLASLGAPKSSQGGGSGVQPPVWVQQCLARSRRGAGAWQGPFCCAPNAGDEQDPAELPQHPRTPTGIPAGPRGRAATRCPVPTCRCRQRVWDFKGSRLNLEPLSSFWRKGSCSGGGVAPWLGPRGKGWQSRRSPKTCRGPEHLANSAGFLCRGARLGPCPAAPIPSLPAWEGKATRLHPAGPGGAAPQSQPRGRAGSGGALGGVPWEGLDPQHRPAGAGEAPKGGPWGWESGEHREASPHPLHQRLAWRGAPAAPPVPPWVSGARGCQGSVGVRGLWVPGSLRTDWHRTGATARLRHMGSKF